MFKSESTLQALQIRKLHNVVYVTVWIWNQLTSIVK